jgi:hypothetical protein
VVSKRSADGIGFTLLDSEIGAFDLDNCRDPETGVIADWAKALVDKAGSYTEITISGTGLRIIGRAVGKETHRKQKVGDDDGELETYRRAGRYIVVTGNQLVGTPDHLANLDDLIDETVAELDRVAKKGKVRSNGASPTKPSGFEWPLPPDLQDLIENGVPVGDRSTQFHHAVGWLKDLGWTVERIEDLLSQHPRGIAEKYEARLRVQIERCFARASDGRDDLNSHNSLFSHPPQPNKWPEPLPQEAFHGLAGDVVLTLEPHTEADRAAILVQFLCAFGNVAGRQSYLQVEGDRHPPQIWPVLVGETAKGRKGTSWGRVKALFEQAVPGWDSRVTSGLSSGEGVIWQVRDPIITTSVDKKTGERVKTETDSGVDDKLTCIVFLAVITLSCLGASTRSQNPVRAVSVRLFLCFGGSTELPSCRPHTSTRVRHRNSRPPIKL